MKLDSTPGDGFLTLELNGRLDTLSAPGVEAAFDAHIEAGSTRLILNMNNVHFINSAGLRVLMTTAKKIARENGKLVFCKLPPEVQSVFEIGGLLSIFLIADDEPAARDMVKA